MRRTVQTLARLDKSPALAGLGQALLYSTGLDTTSKATLRTRSSSPASKTDPRHQQPAPAMRTAPRVMITGGMGQLGRSLASLLGSLYGRDSVLLTDICKYSPAATESASSDQTTPYRYLNILDRRALDELVVNENVGTLVHFSALLSAVAEQNVDLALEVNCHGAENVLGVAKNHKLKVFIPSTIGVFGTTTPRNFTPDVTVQRPKTIYGVSKVYGELLGDYFHEKYGVDFRSLRLPGIISSVQPGGGTTDYAIQMFYDALTTGQHKCYLRPDTQMPMMYGEDCMAGIVNFLNAPSEALSMRTYNITGFSFTPQQLAEHIRLYLPHFQIYYDPCPVRQRIADSWPRSLDDSMARRDWGWAPSYDLESTVEKMLELVSRKLGMDTPVRVQSTASAEEERAAGERTSERTAVVRSSEKMGVVRPPLVAAMM